VVGRILVPQFILSSVVWIGFTLLEIAVTKVWLTDVDINGWPFILIAYPISCVVYVGVMLLTHILMFRRLLKYRTIRRGRAAALRNVLRPSDDQPSGLRRLLLASYGIAPSEWAWSRSLWRPIADDPQSR
jgi:hypothetical protein